MENAKCKVKWTFHLKFKIVRLSANKIKNSISI
uniref:Uncharacterized protein n=1 Tax=Anguilla anguilla TaxID=7936 RepID=A0A0E9VF13_ANGAN